MANLRQLGWIGMVLTSRRELARLFKYLLVGASGVLISLGLLWSLVEYMQMFYLIAAVIAAEVGITNNFIWNEFWTFRDVPRPSNGMKILGRWLQFNLVRGVGIGISLAVLTLLVEIIHIHYFLANLVGTGIAIIINYFMSIGWIWRLKSLEG